MGGTRLHLLYIHGMYDSDGKAVVGYNADEDEDVEAWSDWCRSQQGPVLSNPTWRRPIHHRRLRHFPLGAERARQRDVLLQETVNSPISCRY